MFYYTFQLVNCTCVGEEGVVGGGGVVGRRRELWGEGGSYGGKEGVMGGKEGVVGG